ncbi:MAG: efflux RND transporter periplasmic adaptor subunit [Xanthobacteraceae bacterium]
MRKVLFFALVLAIGAAVLAGTLQLLRHNKGYSAQVQNGGKTGGKRGGSASVPVEISRVSASTTTSDIRAVGSLQSDESVNIAPEVPGRIAEIAFLEGEDVKQGEVLVRLDDSLVRAEIAEQEARFALAKSNLNRANTLAKTGNVTLRARDEATAAFEGTQATLELARVRLSKHTILAPFSGIVGLRRISVGAYVPIGTTIVNLEKIDRLKVDFSIPGRYLADVSVGQSLVVTVDALPNRTFTGKIYAINPMVDVNGRALRIRARLPNAGKELRPGLFARITIKGPTEQRIVTVPESAIVARGGDSFVYRIENGRAVETRVRLGNRKAGFVEVLEGLSESMTVVTAGHQRLRNGSAVEILTSDSRASG